MSLHHVGNARRDLYSDSLLLEVAGDVYVLGVEHLKRFSSRRAGRVPVDRRYEATAPGEHQDFPCGVTLQRSENGFGAVLPVDGKVYAMSVRGLVAVSRGGEDSTRIWQDVPEVQQPADQASPRVWG